MAESDGGSGSTYSGRPRMQMDSTSNDTVASSFAALRNRPTQPIIADHNWHGDDIQNFHQRFAVERYYLPGEPRNVQDYRGGPVSNASSSMAVAINQSQYSLSSYAPSLAGRSATTVSTGPSLRTSGGSSALSRYQAPGRLDEGDDGVLLRPDTATWQCPYWFLRCNERLNTMEDWDSHCQSHFLGVGNLPKHVECPFFGCQWSKEAASGDEAWRHRWAHIWTCHSAGGSINVSKRPDRRLVEHLWRIKAINTAQTKELLTKGVLSGEAYLESASSARDRRRERGGGGRGGRSS